MRSSRLDALALAHRHGEHRPLHRARDRAVRAAREPLAPLSVTARELGPRRLRGLRAGSRAGGRRARRRRRSGVTEPAVRRSRRPTLGPSSDSVVELPRALRELLRLDDPATRLARRRSTGVSSSARWKPSSVVGPSITNSSSARSIRRRARARGRRRGRSASRSAGRTARRSRRRRARRSRRARRCPPGSR